MTFSVPEAPARSFDYEPIPADNHVGICCGVIDLGTHKESYQGGPMKSVHKIKLQFDLPDITREDGKNGIISKTFNLSLHEKASFRIALDAWLGAGWPERYRGKPWSFLLGLPAMVNVTNGQSKRDPARTVAWITGLSKLPRGMSVPAINDDNYDPFYLDLSDCHLPKNLSVYDAEKIRASKEYRSATFVDESPRPQIRPNAPTSVGSHVDDDIDIPW